VARRPVFGRDLAELWFFDAALVPPALRAECLPGPEVRSDAEVLAYARRHGKTDYHPVGTCKMGVDATAVVDLDLKLRGLERLRVCDSSIMPRLVSSNTNAPTLMIGEKAADLIRGMLQQEAMAPEALHAATWFSLFLPLLNQRHPGHRLEDDWCSGADANVRL
jgi:choline dehydrogenase-like flavoprotein